MKKINLLILCSILCLSYSCSGMLDGIQSYLDEGEKIYVEKLDSLKAFSGKNRIKIEGKMMYGVNQVKCVISYKDPLTQEEKTSEFPVERTEPRETFEFMLENLAEGQYDFSVVTYDPKNNTSIPTEVSAYAYGELYHQALTNRILRNVSPEQKTVTDEDSQSKNMWVAKLDWNISRGDGLVGCNIEYEQEDGTWNSKYVPADETATELENFKANGVLRYNTVYKPETTSLDEFATEYKEVSLPARSYVGITKDLTSLYIKNAGYPFTGYDVNNKWGKPYDWKWNEVMETKNANGGAGFTEYNDGTIQFETTQWSIGWYDNGKIWQTFTLPEGRYEMRVEVRNAANIGSGNTNIHFAVAKGEELPDNEVLEQSDIVLSYLKFESEHTYKTSSLPAFELTEETTITVGWVVSFSDICRNIEFKSVRLWSVAE